MELWSEKGSPTCRFLINPSFVVITRSKTFFPRVGSSTCCDIRWSSRISSSLQFRSVSRKTVDQSMSERLKSPTNTISAESLNSSTEVDQRLDWIIWRPVKNSKCKWFVFPTENINPQELLAALHFPLETTSWFLFQNNTLRPSYLQSVLYNQSQLLLSAKARRDLGSRHSEA